MNFSTCLLQLATWGIKTSLGTKEWTNHPPSPPADRGFYEHLQSRRFLRNQSFVTGKRKGAF